MWRSNIAVDRRLPGGITGTAEFIYNRDVNGIYYINANLPAAQTAFTGADNRPRWVGTACAPTPGRASTASTTPPATRSPPTIVMKNQDIGRNWNIAFSASKPMWHGLSLRTAYSYGEAKNTIDPGSTANASWNSNPTPGDPNNPGLGFSTSSPGHRFFLSASLHEAVLRLRRDQRSRRSGRRRTLGNTSYIFAADANGDGGATNDLIYIPRDRSEMNFRDVHRRRHHVHRRRSRPTAFEAYIAQDKYLSKHRGEYAERGAVFLPLLHKHGPEPHPGRVQEHQGQAQRRPVPHRHPELRQPAELELGRRPARHPQQHPDARRWRMPTARLSYRMQVVNNQLVRKTFESTSGLLDVYQFMLSFRYSFN